MSYSTLYLVFKTRTKIINEYRNGHGTAPPLWDLLCEKHLHKEPHYWLVNEDPKELWALYENSSVPLYRRFTLFMTFDRAVVDRPDFQRAVECCQKLYQEIKNTKPNMVNHWQSIADDIKNIGKIDHRALGIGLGCTSVCDPWEEWEPKKDRTIWKSSKYLHN